MALKSPSVDVLLVMDMLLGIRHHFVSLTLSVSASSMGQLSDLDYVDDVGHFADASSAEVGAFPSRCVLVLLLPFLVDEAVDPDSACEAEPIHALVLFLPELDGFVLPEFGSAT